MKPDAPCNEPDTNEPAKEPFTMTPDAVAGHPCLELNSAGVSALISVSGLTTSGHVLVGASRDAVQTSSTGGTPTEEDLLQSGELTLS